MVVAHFHAVHVLKVQKVDHLRLQFMSAGLAKMKEKDMTLEHFQVEQEVTDWIALVEKEMQKPDGMDCMLPLEINAFAQTQRRPRRSTTNRALASNTRLSNEVPKLV